MFGENKSILILGASGMAGSVIFNYLKVNSNFKILGTSFSKRIPQGIALDATNLTALKKVIYEIKPLIIINCIGALVKDSEENLRKAIQLNTLLPLHLDTLSSELNFKLIHISTDCVFSGKHGNYSWNSDKDAIDNYGVSKSLGECIGNENLLIRTSIIGPELSMKGTGLLHWFLTTNEQRVSGFTKAIWSGVTTLELAKYIKFSIENNISGIVQLTNGIKISKYKLLELVQKTFNKKVLILRSENKHLDKSLIPYNLQNYIVPDYENMIEELNTYMNSFHEIYKHYF